MSKFTDNLITKIEAFEKRYGSKRDIWQTAQFNDELVVICYQSAMLGIHITKAPLREFANWLLTPEGSEWMFFHNNSLSGEMVDTIAFMFELHQRGLLVDDDEANRQKIEADVTAGKCAWFDEHVGRVSPFVPTITQSLESTMGTRFEVLIKYCETSDDGEVVNASKVEFNGTADELDYEVTSFFDTCLNDADFVVVRNERAELTIRRDHLNGGYIFTRSR